MLQVMCIDQKETWIIPIVHTLHGIYDNLDNKELAKLQRKATRYTILDSVLYKKGFSHSLLRCLSPSEVEYVMREIHKVQKDAHQLVHTCDSCQIYAKVQRQPAELLQITLAQSSVKMPQANGQVETMNKKILTALKKKVGQAKGAWLEELPGILWALRTSPHTTTGETTFSLVYGTEVAIPAEIGMRSHRTIHFDEYANQEGYQAQP
ncbi:Retrovirus-related Pol polyprotein from transposon 17.6 [Gossypium australe]|uniref:Retrovirus-related Pol polyprotein from transposon 17.6 n=1 Tax=Gossypium australe TaxID=47621 RepID=A0A5B6VVM0_9ROSI|nr:Retrovirus-related Pol polyprotein from transposon 17.6 [Gossypium australe]